MQLYKRSFNLLGCGVALAAIGIFVMGGVVLILQRNSQPFSMPVSLAVSETKSPEFRTHESRPYNLIIEVKKKLPFDQLNCMLGTSLISDPTCHGRLLRARWALLSEGLTLAQGTTGEHSSGSWSNDSIGCYIGRFQATAGKKYTLVLNVEEDGTALAVTEPRLVVRIADGYYGVAQGFILWPIFFCLEGLALLLITLGVIGRVLH